MENYTNPHITSAMKCLQAAIPRCQADFTRPIYHFRAPAQWMDDPNGIIYHKNYYHLFYNHNPYIDRRMSPKYWGHARSKDLIHWEHLPVALWPSREEGEDDCWFGCTVINDKGQPMIIYTSIGPEKRPEDNPEQWAAFGDDDLINWKKYSGNPIMTDALHGKIKVSEWRDPFVFREHDRTFMVLGGKVNQKEGGSAVVTIYEADDEELIHWTYRGILFRHPNKKLRSLECPNILKLGDRWLLIVSPHPCPVEYFVGTFDLETFTFEPESQGIVDRNTNFYATNVLSDDKGRHILWGCILGFKQGRGWNGCFSLPRVLSISPDGQLIQEPVPELGKLRSKYQSVSDIHLKNESLYLKNTMGNALEILAEFEPGNGKNCGLRLQSCNESNQVRIACNKNLLDIAGTYVPIPLSGRKEMIRLRLFLDRSLLEVYVNGNECATSVIDSVGDEVKVELFAEKGNMRLKALKIWEMKSMWS